MTRDINKFVKNWNNLRDTKLTARLGENQFDVDVYALYVIDLKKLDSVALETRIHELTAKEVIDLYKEDRLHIFRQQEIDFNSTIVEPINTFVDDIDKVTDLMQMILDSKSSISGIINFLKSYSYMDIFEVEETVKALDEVEVLADIYRQGENMYQDDINDRETGCNVTGEQVKDVVSTYAKWNLNTDQCQELYEILDSMGC